MLALAPLVVLSACGGVATNSVSGPELENLHITGTLVALQWACLGDTAKTTADRMDKLQRGDEGKLSSKELMANIDAIGDLYDQMLNGTPLSDHSDELLGLAVDPPLLGGTAEPCDNPGDSFGYADVHDGTQVTIADETGTTLGLSELKNGRITMHGTIWNFTAEVPESEFYQLTVGERGSVQVSHEDLAGGRIALALG